MGRAAASGAALLHFPISCSAQSQRQFDQAMTLLHSMQYQESEQAYAAITEAEPNCAMAYWGMAMSRLKRPIAVLPLPEDIRAGRKAMKNAVVARTATPRERAGLHDPIILHNFYVPAGRLRQIT